MHNKFQGCPVRLPDSTSEAVAIPNLIYYIGQ